MKKKSNIFKTLLTVIITVVVTTLIVTNIGFGRILSKSEYKKYKKLMVLMDVIDDEFYKNPDESKLEDGMYKGLFSGLDDEYSSYYTKEEMKELMEVSSGKYSGVGLIVTPDKESGLIKVQQVMKNGPAKSADVRDGDFITEVNGKKYTYQEMDLAVKQMRGEANTPVEISIFRSGEIIKKKITRKEISVETIISKKLENDIGYIEITSFDEDTDVDFIKALDELEKQKIKGLIIDVRNNGGGYLNVVNTIADRLLGKSVIVYTMDRDGKKEYMKSSDKEKVDIPIAILTNGYSASASEILTGAILDNKAGISVGQNTFGKGLVQSVIQLGDGSGYKITTSQYFTPAGNNINKKGIKPTIEVKEEKDQLPKAIEYMNSKIKK